MIKKICFFTNKVSLSGGAERVICTLASNFSKMGIDTTIITQNSTECGYPLHENVKIVATKTKCKIPGVRFLIRCFLLRKNLKKISPDVAVSFMVDNNLILSLFALGLPCVRIGSDRIFPKIITGVRAKLCRLIYPLCDGFVFQTKEARDCFRGKVRERSTVIANPLVGEIPDRGYPISNDIVTVGRLSAQKNQALLIKAFAKFNKIHLGYRLLVYGNGEKKAELSELINNLELSDSVMLMGNSNKVLLEICCAKMFVLTSDYEGMPNALAEAMAIGIPSVSTDCLGGGAAALIKDNVNGKLVPVGDEDGVVKAMSELVENEEMYDNISANSVKLRETLAVDNISKMWLSYMDEVLKTKKSK